MSDLCTACNKRFRSTYAFDKHRTGQYQDPQHPGRPHPTNPRRCMSTEEMESIGMAINAHGVWVSERMELEPAF